ncbi:hypothetical protein A2U01_0055756, partial [Trifolium medium]|nr:hypothetical protein [Trifolium medium]
TPPTSPPPTPSTASATPTPPLPPPTLARTSQPPYIVWSQPKQTGAQTAHTKESHPPRALSRKKYLTRPPPFSKHAPRTICPLAHHHPA